MSMKNVAELVMKAQQVQARAKVLQEKLEKEKFIGTAAHGRLSITITGKGVALSSMVDSTLLGEPDNKKLLEELFVIAVNEAKRKVEQYQLAEMEKIQSSLGLPKDFKMPF